MPCTLLTGCGFRADPDIKGWAGQVGREGTKQDGNIGGDSLWTPAGEVV